MSPFARVTPVRYEKSTGQSDLHENITSSSVFITRGSKVTFACAVDTQRRTGRARRIIFFMILEIKNRNKIFYNEANDIDTKSKKK
jgi:hypothetical protein